MIHSEMISDADAMMPKLVWTGNSPLGIELSICISLPVSQVPTWSLGTCDSDRRFQI
jgi:hypothetical protein